jgi:hypothetical protein
MGTKRAFVARGREAFERLRGSAGAYGELLDLLKAHKWVVVRLATDDSFRAAYKLNKKRSIDVLREAYRHNNSEVPTQQFSHAEGLRRGAVVVAGVVMYLRLVSGTGGSLLADHYTSDVGKALVIAERLESAGLRPNIVRSGSKYVVYIATTDLLRLAEKDDAVRRAVALYLAEKAKNGTPKQRDIAEKILKRHPLFLYYLFVSPLSRSQHRCALADIELGRRAWPMYVDVVYISESYVDSMLNHEECNLLLVFVLPGPGVRLDVSRL